MRAPTRFNQIDLYRKAGKAVKPLYGKTRQIKHRPVDKVPLDTIPQMFDKLSGPIADYITGEREKKDRENMQKALMAYRSGLPGQKERIDLSEQEIMDKYARPAKAAVIGGPMDIDETSDDIERRADNAWFNALPDKDDQGRFTQGKRLEGFDAAVAAAGDKPGPVTQKMLNALMLSDMDRKQVIAAEQRGIEDFRTKAGITASHKQPAGAKTTKDADGFVRYLDGPNAGERVFPDVKKTPDEPDPITLLTGFEEETKLRKEFTASAKDFVKVRDAWSRIQASAKSPSAAGDLALIFNYMKVLDPGSTVREGEFATAAASAGIPDRIRAQYNKIVKGERLAPPQRADFVNRGYKLYQAQADQYQGLEDRYRTVSKDYGLNPDRVVYPMGGNVTEYIKDPPTVGAVADGYTFLGGDPADPKSWKKN